MYNKVQKMEYIASLNSDITKNAIKCLFEITAESEEKFEIDCCEFDVNKISDFYKSLYTPSLHRLLNYNSYLKNYTAHCLSKNLVSNNQNNYENMSKDMITKCINSGLLKEKFITREELIEFLNENVKNSYEKVLYLGIFEGLWDTGCESLIKATKDNIVDNKFIMQNGKEIEISKELENLMLQSADSYTGESNGGVFEVVFKNVPNIIKPKRNSKSDIISYGTIKVLFLKLNEEYGTFFSAKSLKESGRIDYIKRLYREKGYTDKYKCIYENMGIIQDRYGKFTINEVIDYVDIREA